MGDVIEFTPQGADEGGLPEGWAEETLQNALKLTASLEGNGVTLQEEGDEDGNED